MRTSAPNRYRKSPGRRGDRPVVTRASLAALLLFVSAARLEGQDLLPPRVEVAAGTSFVTGLPHRPRPPAGEGLSGAAGQDPGMHARVSVLFPWMHWLDLAGELSYNRLESAMPSFNCLRDDADSGTCYPAAVTDQLVSLIAGARLSVPSRFSPYLAVGGGAGVFLLEADKRLPNVALSDATRTRALVRAGGGVTFPVSRHRVGIEAGLIASLGRGGGSHHVPLVVTFAW